MSNKICLPYSSVVSRWKEEKVIKWLKKVNLDDCIPAFEARHIDGLKLLDLTEQKLFTYQDMKIKHRKQIAKCVQECKSQASNAKRIAKSLKRSNGTKSQASLDSNEAYDSDEDSDLWGSEFDDSEDESREDCMREVNNNSIVEHLTGLNDKISASCPVLATVSSEEKLIPQPPDVSLVAKSVLDATRRTSLTGSIPRPPIKRPDSQPPPPPVPQQSTSQEPQEDYEIPIVRENASSRENIAFTNTSFGNGLNNNDAETYEIVEPPEENYEVVGSPTLQSTMTEKPLLPPRHFKQSDSSPPPLPQKPTKLNGNNNGTSPSEHGIRTFSRPKLPNESFIDIATTTNSSQSTHVGFISSLMSRSKPIVASLKMQGKAGDVEHVVAASPDRDGTLSVSKAIPIPPLPPRGTPVGSPDDSASNMATRPLPPVPVVQDKSVQLRDVSDYPWFQELEREAAECEVRQLGEAGSFVVRPSKRAGKENPYSLTVLHEEKLFHLNIRLRPDGTFALGKEKEKEKTFPSVAELIIFHLNEPILLKNRGESAGRTILGKFPPKDL